MPRTAKDREIIDRLTPPAAPISERDWPYSPDEATLMVWLNTAIWHYAGIRATGSVPTIGGPAAQIPAPSTASTISFRSAALTAENFWPNARSFDLIGSDLAYKDAVDESPADALPPGMGRLRNAVVIATFTVTDRPPVPTPPVTTQPENNQAA